MDYPSQADLLTADPLKRWIDSHFLRRDPFAFNEVGFDNFLALVAEEFGVEPNGIYCVGSGAIGLSINPGKVFDGGLKMFDGSSDLDIALISELYFEQAWRDLRLAAEPSLEPMSEVLEKSLMWQKKRFFDGVILANVLTSELSFGPAWNKALVKVEEEASLLLNREIDVHVWIYRDYWSLRNYVMSGIMRCREALI